MRLAILADAFSSVGRTRREARRTHHWKTYRNAPTQQNPGA
jgi:hypothetical protein